MSECCFCKNLCGEWGNNPYPLKENGRCCDECNQDLVIIARILKIKINDAAEKLVHYQQQLRILNDSIRKKAVTLE